MINFFFRRLGGGEKPPPEAPPKTFWLIYFFLAHDMISRLQIGYPKLTPRFMACSHRSITLPPKDLDFRHNRGYAAQGNSLYSNSKPPKAPPKKKKTLLNEIEFFTFLS